MGRPKRSVMRTLKESQEIQGKERDIRNLIEMTRELIREVRSDIKIIVGTPISEEQAEKYRIVVESLDSLEVSLDKMEENMEEEGLLTKLLTVLEKMRGKIRAIIHKGIRQCAEQDDLKLKKPEGRRVCDEKYC